MTAPTPAPGEPPVPAGQVRDLLGLIAQALDFSQRPGDLDESRAWMADQACGVRGTLLAAAMPRLDLDVEFAVDQLRELLAERQAAPAEGRLA